MKTVGWKDADIAAEYIDESELFKKHAGKGLF